MLEIVLCDDNKDYLDIEERQISEYCRTAGIVNQITKFTSAVEMVERIKNNQIRPNVFFLDLEMRPLSGIQAAEEINRLLPAAQIVFVSGYVQYITDVYETNHIYYVLKGELEERLEQVFEKIHQRTAMEEEYLLLEQKGIRQLVKQNKIQYVERIGRKTRIVLSDDIIETTEKVDEIYKKLNQTIFVHSHTSFIVNLFLVEEYHRYKFVMKNGKEIPISRSCVPEAREKFVEWVKIYQ